MYKILCNGKEIVRQGVDRISAISGRLTQQINAADQFTFTLPASHPYLSDPQPRSSIVELWRDNDCLFIGDVLQVDIDIYNDVTFSCQGALAWLNDSVVPHPSFSGEASEYFERLIIKYSGDAEQARKLNFGTSDVSTQIEIDYADDIKSVFELVSEIISNVGGYLFVRYDGNDIYVDYITDKGRTSGQSIRFGENLTGIENCIDASKLITRVYPLGKDGLDIRTVNNGKWFIANNELESVYGVIATTIKFDDIEDATTLKTLATSYLNASTVVGQTLSLTAIDLSLIDSRIDRIEVGDAVKVQSPAHGLDTTLKVVRKETDIISPENSELELGLTIKSISGMVGGVGGSPSVGGGSVTHVGAVRYDTVQTLTDAQKAQARENIGAGTGGGTTEGAVRYDVTQILTDAEKSKARSNIGASDFDGDGSNVTAAFTQASARANIISGETLGTLFGKIKKVFADLKTVAFTGSYTDLSDQPTIPTVNNGKLTIKQGSTVKGEFTANSSGDVVIPLDGGVTMVNGKTGVVSLNADDINSTKPVPVVEFVVEGEFDIGLVALTKDGRSCTAADFRAAINSGSTVLVSAHDQTRTVTFSADPIKYTIGTNGYVTLYILAQTGHNFSPAMFTLRGMDSDHERMELLEEYDYRVQSYQAMYANASSLPYAEIRTVEQYLEALDARLTALEGN